MLTNSFFGKVLKMKRIVDNRCYAVKQVKVKFLNDNGVYVNTIIKEADTLFDISHSHIVMKKNENI